ncbi:hypothetical protein A2773_05215 [Candidatus Gottesmanbacteria bacterium RIFCSPHIGHO2_01_FULL_39_10]|uniref:Uncharacterized protein n=1 Tax=Candidatus Gottesmanbacteria bacterium RIFCSPHIGHO2_01_FULL_39_10 TaxID=1798375 RepID=A0A1F5ZPT8_9BACT|nr:MAG: hypothetical protein A2773_05215 [Candidatus Gottesmanbacteria bacterium RIFCSPHIGHO2_01_FULL_39_10]
MLEALGTRPRTYSHHIHDAERTIHMFVKEVTDSPITHKPPLIIACPDDGGTAYLFEGQETPLQVTNAGRKVGTPDRKSL